MNLLQNMISNKFQLLDLIVLYTIFEMSLICYTAISDCLGAPGNLFSVVAPEGLCQLR